MKNIIHMKSTWSPQTEDYKMQLFYMTIIGMILDTEQHFI